MSDDNPAKDTRPVVFWTCDDAPEELTWTDPEDAVRYWLDGMLDPKCDVLVTLPKTVTLFGYARMTLGPNEVSAVDILDDVLEKLDEEHGDPDHPTIPTDAMETAAKAFVDVILSEYKVWSCEQVSSEEIDVEKWVRENEPGWLE